MIVLSTPVTLGAVQTTKSRTYGNSNWLDQLTNINGTAITYDNMGNPLKWHNASSLTWEGRKLKTFTKTDGTVISYTYDENGIRTGKKIGSENVEYVLSGTNIVQEKRANYTLTFLYDGGSLVGFNYKTPTANADYYYGIDNFGNINYIYDSNGNIVVTYKYDAWGKLISTTGSLAGTIGAINPYRYNLYYYDTESSLYYLYTRYYDSGLCKFMSSDETDYLLAECDISSYNLYIYCENDPVNKVDKFGYISISDYWNSFKDEYSRLTQDERKLFIKYWYKAHIVYMCRKLSFIWTKKFYGADFDKDDWAANAFKHAMWNACMAFYLGSYIAELFGTAHESEAMKSRDPHVIAATKMDLHNNEVGRRLGENYAQNWDRVRSMYRLYGSTRISTPPKINDFYYYHCTRIDFRKNSHDQNLALLVLTAAVAGELVWIK